MATQSSSLVTRDPSYVDGKHLAHRIFLETIAAIEVRHAMLAKVRLEGNNLVASETSTPLLRPPLVIAFGKAANRMTSVLADILKGGYDRGIGVSPVEPAAKLERFHYFRGGHPYPNQGSIEGAKAALELVSGLKSDDVVIFLVSGGGSAIFEAALDPEIKLADLIEFNKVLVTSGLPIEQINTLRKHISAVKGGRLAVQAYPARQLTIYISDVPQGLPSMVASGPTLPDESTVEACYKIAEEHGLVSRLPTSIRNHFERRALEETPKPSDGRFANSRFFCLLSSRDAVRAARDAAEKCGFVCDSSSEEVELSYEEAAKADIAALELLIRANPGKPVCLIRGGEVGCAVKGHGMGGRNQAFVLYAAKQISGQQRVVLSAGTDGKDGNSPSAGAVADGQTLSRARALGLDPDRFIADSDSYHFFCTLGDTVDIGFTNNNVRDVRIWLHFPG